jgi:nucleoside-diphosphate-sugar epimerase
LRAASPIVGIQDQILLTGASGFIGVRVVDNLLRRGFRKVRCLVRESSNLDRLSVALHGSVSGQAEVVQGNLLSKDDCVRVAKDATVIFHLAASTGTKAFSDAVLHSVVTTRNLLDATLEDQCLKRFVNVSSFAVYTNRKKPKWRLLDERSPIEDHPESRAQAYCYGKVRQDELVVAYGREHSIPYVILRPGSVFGPGKNAIPARVGIDSFGFFLHLGGPNPIPFTYVDNCADAIVLAGLVPGIEGEVFNIVDDDVPSSRRFLRLYKRNVKKFRSFYMPHSLSYLFWAFWEALANRSRGQLPPVFTRREWTANWKKTRFSNEKLKKSLDWTPGVSMEEGLDRFFEYCRDDVNRSN